MPADRLWQLITTNAARALGMEAQVGSLSPGRCADAAVFHGVGNDPLAELLDAQVLPSQVWIGGERVAGDSAS
jgi:imidazolonepropionase-like amidohydrolase